MTQDEIIRMAREAGFLVDNALFLESVSLFERFAALVAEPWIKTNKALANEIIELKKQVDISALPIIIEAAVKEAVLAEREACAQVCEDWHFETEDPRDVAAAIRNRGER